MPGTLSCRLEPHADRSLNTLGLHRRKLQLMVAQWIDKTHVFKG